jgi:hypothetical protein
MSSLFIENLIYHPSKKPQIAADFPAEKSALQRPHYLLEFGHWMPLCCFLCWNFRTIYAG